MGIPLYNLLDIVFGYQPLNLFIQGIALFGIMSPALMEHVILIEGACIGSDFHWWRIIINKFFTLNNDIYFNDSGVQGSGKPLKIWQPVMGWLFLVVS